MPNGKYEKSAERANPACIIFLLDQSYSMNDGIAGSSRPKIDALTTAINRFIADLIALCEKGEDKPRHYFDVGVIGYTTDRNDPPNPIIGPVLKGANGTLNGHDLVSVVDLFDDPLAIEDRQKQVDDGAGGLVTTTVKFPVWYRKPSGDAMSGTPMCAALQYVQNIASTWCAGHPGSFPPVIIHLSDGEATDGDPEPVAEALKALSTEDGQLLLFNCHVS
ncbi:MAG: vWA domain-containing protein, partial [Isosphaeraceae bacterium]